MLVRRAVLVLATVGAALFLVPTVLAETATLPAGCDTPAWAASGELDGSAAPLFGPGVVWQSTTCTATKECGDGTQAQCTGTSYCEVLSSGVRCDGVITRCPNYCELERTCYCSCGNTRISCSSNVGACEATEAAIRCDGQWEACVMPCYQMCGYPG